jgi:hypothetical protein
MTMNEPLSYEPAGSRKVTLSVVPTVMGPLEAELLEEAPPDGPVHAVSASRETPASAIALRTADVVLDINDLL